VYRILVQRNGVVAKQAVAEMLGGRVDGPMFIAAGA
jgi:hypothetical protein